MRVRVQYSLTLLTLVIGISFLVVVASRVGIAPVSTATPRPQSSNTVPGPPASTDGHERCSGVSRARRTSAVVSVVDTIACARP